MNAKERQAAKLALTAVLARLIKADAELRPLRDDSLYGSSPSEFHRLAGKIEGVSLARSYVEEELRDKSLDSTS